MSIPDPRNHVATVQHGTRMRDAAVNPIPAVDFLEPSNAGVEGELGNPHGPSVVSPGLHGDESVRTIKDGPVSPNADTQDAAERTTLAASQPQTAAG